MGFKGKVKDIMATNVISISPALGLDALDQEFTLNGIGGAPVVDHKKVLGVVSRSDIIKQLNIEQTNALIAYDYYDAPFIDSNDPLNLDRTGAAVGERMAHMTVRDVMNSSVLSVTPNQSLTAAANLMVEKNIHRLLVLEDEELVGLVSSMDFVKLMSAMD